LLQQDFKVKAKILQGRGSLPNIFTRQVTGYINVVLCRPLLSIYIRRL